MEISSIVEKYQKYTDDGDLYKNILEDLLAKLQNSEFSIMKQYHKNLSFATGINLGICSENSEEKNIFKRIEKFLIKIMVIINTF